MAVNVEMCLIGKKDLAKKVSILSSQVKLGGRVVDAYLIVYHPQFLGVLKFIRMEFSLLKKIPFKKKQKKNQDTFNIR